MIKQPAQKDARFFSAPQHAVPFHSFAMNWNASIDPADALATMKNPLATMKIFLEAPVVSDAVQKTHEHNATNVVCMPYYDYDDDYNYNYY
jgi:hypothetical protein